MPVQLHTVTEKAIDAQLDQVEKIAKQVNIRPLRWAFMHMEAVTPAQVDRMKKLNMFLAINPRESCQADSSIKSRVTKRSECRR